MDRARPQHWNLNQGLCLLGAPRSLAALLALALATLATGCAPSQLLARLMISPPNQAPTLIQPQPRVTLRWDPGLLERFPAATNSVGTPPARLTWMRLDAAHYPQSVDTLQSARGDRTFGDITLRVQMPAQGLPTPMPALGTVFLIHGYAVDLETLFPLGLNLANAGWRCILVDLRGHGLSDGDRVTFGIQETRDVMELRDQLERSGEIHGPYLAVGHSLGGAVALRWQATDSRIKTSVALGAPARFVPAVERVRSAYSPWVPSGWARRAALRIPKLLEVEPWALDTTSALALRPPHGLLICSSADDVTPPEDAAEILAVMAPRSRLLVIGGATHETLPYAVDQFGSVLRAWLLTAAGIRSGIE